MKSFLGLTSYYRKFVLQYATISTPLSDLLKVECTPECERAFQTLKEKLGESPVLIVPDFSRPFVVQTDASNVGIGAVLTQKEADDKEHPVAFVGHKLKPREKNYSVVEKNVTSHCLGPAVLLSLPLRPTLCGGNRPSTANMAATDEKPKSDTGSLGTHPPALQV